MYALLLSVVLLRLLNTQPKCKRMVTVRELARSQGFPDHFVFESLRNNVVTVGSPIMIHELQIDTAGRCTGRSEMLFPFLLEQRLGGS
jgi:hypothetical protein